MERIVYRITLDSHKTGIQRTLQGFETADNMARTIAVNITASGDTYEIPLDNVVAMMYVTTPGASEPSVNECRIEDNTIIYDVLPIVEEGITEMQLKLIETSVDGAKKVLIAPRFAVEVTESGTEDDGAEQTTTFTALEAAIAKAQGVYDARLLRIDIGEDCVFRAIYADGTVYENHYFHEALYNGNALLSESWAKGGTGIREGEETNNSKYFSDVSRSSSIEASASADEVRNLVDFAKLHSTYTSFDTNFETGELEYISASHTFDIDETTGELSVEGDLFDPSEVLESVADDYMDEKTQEIAQLKSDLNEETAERKAEIAVERERINQLTALEVGSTTGDAELIDARVDYKGTTHSNLGEHIRSVTGKLRQNIGESKRSAWWHPDATLTDAQKNDISYFYKNAILDVVLNNAEKDVKYSFAVLNYTNKIELTIWNSETYAFVCSYQSTERLDRTGIETVTLANVNSNITAKVKVDFSVLKDHYYPSLIYRYCGIDESCYSSTKTIKEQELLDRIYLHEQATLRRWQNKKWYAIGDSFTEQNIYPYYLNDYCKFGSYYNAGQSGKGMRSMCDKLSVEPLTNYDIVTVLCGTNDYGSGTVLGSINDDSATDSFYGYTKKLIETIIAQKPTIRIAFFTPVKRGVFENQPVYPNANNVGHTLENYVDAIVEVCKMYSVPCLDTFRCSQFNELTLSALTQDNLHPNYEGGKLLARQMQGFIETL